jgi:Chlorophyll A-B binding protein
MKLTIIASLLTCASAFAPQQSVLGSGSRNSMALNADFSKEIGAQAPLGFFDPLKLTADASQEEFDRLRLCELKHGRIAMLAVVGNLVTLAGVRFPGMLSSEIAFADMPSGLAGLNAVPPAGLVQILMFIFCMEVGTSTLKGGEFPGDYTGTPSQPDFKWASQSDKWKTQKRTIEINNGRAAMMGIWGLVIHDMMGNLDEIIYTP